jgi:nucleoside-diphosphate-sugar epimerase
MKKQETIFLTGGSGFIGKHFRKMAAKLGYRVFVLSRKNIEVYYNETLIKGSLVNDNDWNLPDKDIQYVVHLAGEKKNEQNMQSINVDAVATMIDFTLGLNEARFIHMGSAGVYGIAHHPETVIDEKSEVFPLNRYELTKYEADLFIQNKSKESHLNYVILRPTNVFGIEEPSFKLLNLMRSIKRNIFFIVDPEAMVNYIGVKSLCRYLFEAFTILKPGTIYNVNAPCNIADFYRIINDAIEGETRAPKKLPGVLHGLFKFACKVGDYLPRKFQIINSGKYRELTDRRYIDSGLLQASSAEDQFMELKEEINELALWYKKQNLL